MKARHRGRRALIAALTAATVGLASTAIALPAANAFAPVQQQLSVSPAVVAVTAPSGTVPLTPAGAPQSIPGLTNWTPGTGQFTLGANAKVVSQDATLRNDLAATLSGILGRTVSAAATGAAAGDLEIAIDASRASTLGKEGYQLNAGSTLKVTGATATGAFYGTQTIIQFLRQGNVVPAGSSVDIPKYEERGVGLCACQVNISMESLERTMKDMAYNKLNQLWLETKLKSDAYPKANFWAYYTKAEAAQISAWAKKYHVQLILEVNSPGHMRPWLYNYPELQLVNNSGNKKVEQLDITQPEAFTMVTKLADEYLAAFPDSPYWHMGGDEYMMGDSYNNYSQFAAYVAAHPEIFPAGSGPGDVFIWFMNKVNAYVKAKGKTLRIWNDGVPKSSVVPLDKDIVVEYWYNNSSTLTPQQLLDAGFKVQNSSQALYFNRPDSYVMRPENLWNSGWTPAKADGGSTMTDVPGKGSVIGAKLTAWPDDSSAKTESQVEEQLFASMRFLAQATWGSEKPTADYAKFAALSSNLGRAPGYDSYDRTPVGDGGYSIKVGGKNVNATATALDVNTAAASTWTLTATADHYYKIVSAAGTCLGMAGGVQWLNAPMDQDLAPSLAACSTARNANNLQKWEVLKNGNGFTIRNAVTQMPLSLTAAGALTQQAPDVRAASVFTLVGEVSTSLTAPARIVQGQATAISVVVDNRTEADASNVVVTPVVPAGWAVTPATLNLGTIAAGGTGTASFTVTAPATAAFAKFSITASAAFTSGGTAQTSAGTPANTLLSCAVAPLRPVAATVDNEQNNSSEVTLGRNAIDGDPNTFWGTAWSPADSPLPHTISADLGKEMSVCGINALPRQGNGSGAINGRIKAYEVYVSSVAGQLGSKVAEGTFPNEQSLQTVSFASAVTGRYVSLRALSEQNGMQWTTLAELTVDAGEIVDVPSPTATPTTEPTTEPTTTAPTTAPTTQPTTATTAPTTPTTNSPSVPAGGVIAPSTVTRGQSVSFVGKGFAVAEKVSGTVRSEPLSLGTVAADGQGGVRFDWTVPADFELGSHTVTLVGADSGLSYQARFTVVDVVSGGNNSTTPGAVANPDELPNTGVTSLALWLGAAALIALGGLVLLMSRKRSGLHS